MALFSNLFPVEIIVFVSTLSDIIRAARVENGPLNNGYTTLKWYIDNALVYVYHTYIIFICRIYDFDIAYPKLKTIFIRISALSSKSQ